tara:strand:- start:191 stop:796 length:606 start_codon:yes stop_codon:yes gene_type:complete
MLVLDLFCGTKSLKPYVEKKGWDYIGLDNEEKHNPEILKDFLEWDYTSVNPDIIWASPDCAVYSMLAGNRHFDINRQPKTEKAKIQLKLLDKLKKCINYHVSKNPNVIFFIENPTARLVWFITEYPRYDVSYCKYGFDRMKPTTIWTNKKGFTPKRCKNGNPDCHHLKTPRGCRTHGTQAIAKFERYKVPAKLIEDLFKDI